MIDSSKEVGYYMIKEVKQCKLHIAELLMKITNNTLILISTESVSRIA